MKMKGFLKSAEGLFQLAPKVTTVGLEGCDLVVQTPGVDHQHAIIEFSEQENCFVLQDLNTNQGTYVNDCRVHNAAVRLAPGDVIRFGFACAPHELHLDSHPQVMYPPVHQRAAWTQPLTVITDPPLPQMISTEQSLPQLKTVVNTTYSAAMREPESFPATNTIPRPPTTIRGRPLSAGAISRKPPQFVDQRGVTGAGWVGGGSPARSVANTPPQQTADIALLQEKEQALLRLNEEVKRLTASQAECQRKDAVILQLRDEVADLHRRSRVNDSFRSTPASVTGPDGNIPQRLGVLEGELALKNMEIQSLKEQIAAMKENGRGSPSSVNRQELNDRILEINSLRTELERVKKDKNITSGLVTQMQKDMANKDTTISRLTRDLEAIKKDLSEKDVQVSSLQSKFRRTQEAKKTEEDVEAKETELAALKQKFKTTEGTVQDQLEVISSLKEELEKVTKQAADEKDSQKKLQTDLDAARSKSSDLERAERQVRVDLEQTSKRLERFRNRVLQTTFSTPGIKAPDKELADDELLETLKNIIDERTDLLRKLQDSKDKLTSANSIKKDVIEGSKKLKQSLNEAVERLRERGLLSSRLRQEIDLVQTVSLDESVSWMRDLIIALLQVAVTWEAEIESALEECGVNVKISDDEPWKHIAHLRSLFEEQKGECVTLRSRLIEVDEAHKAEMEAALEALTTKMEDRIKDEALKLEIENGEKLNAAIEEIKTAEAEKLEEAMEKEGTKYSEQEAFVEQLKASLLEKEEEISSHKEAAREATEAADVMKNLETELREQIAALEKSREEDAERLKLDLENETSKQEEREATYKEQIRQHSVTICAMEERLNKVIKKSKDYQAEITAHKKTINELKSKASAKPVPPPKPKVIIQKPAVDPVILEQTIQGLQTELASSKTQVQEQQDVITGLRRDMAGASARLSDMTGELSEAQKEEMEKNRATITIQERELTELRQQMVKLSQIIDSKSAEITELNNDIAKQRASLSKYKHVSEDRDLKIQDLENLLKKEKDESKKHLSLIEDEGRITSELTAMGAQCRGDRHEQVISRQREALTELRARIKVLEQERPPLPTHDQALQQVVLLKKELAELRATQALQDTDHVTSALSSSQNEMLQQQISKARGMDSQARVEVDMERSAHRETIEALEASEGTYLTLLRNMAGALELDEVAGLRSMAHIPKDERYNLVAERERVVQLLASSIKVLRERIVRKDELLQGYERDLAKLRQAEKLAEQKSVQLESLVGDVRSKSEESQYLRESLNRTRDRLDQEKRLNSAIKAKKTYHLERENATKGPLPRYHSPPEDILAKEKAKKKHHSEKIKRKNYEIKTLKTELTSRERDLQGARRRVVQLENTMGVSTDRDPLEPPAIASH